MTGKQKLLGFLIVLTAVMNAVGMIRHLDNAKISAALEKNLIDSRNRWSSCAAETGKLKAEMKKVRTVFQQGEIKELVSESACLDESEHVDVSATVLEDNGAIVLARNNIRLKSVTPEELIRIICSLERPLEPLFPAAFRMSSMKIRRLEGFLHAELEVFQYRLK